MADRGVPRSGSIGKPETTSISSVQPQKRRHAHAQDHRHRPQRFPQVGFRRPCSAILEYDRRFADAGAGAAAAVEHLFLERVARRE